MTDYWDKETEQLSDPAANAAEITPSDTTDLAQASRGIWVGYDGTLKVTMVRGQVVTFRAVTAGQFIPIRVKRVWATGTSAQYLVAIW